MQDHGTETEKPEIENFRVWNEEMVAKHDPEAYHLHSNWAIRFIEGLRVLAVLQAVKAAKGRVLEIGCGAGNVLERVSAKRLFGIDFSIRMVSRTRERLKGKPLSVLQADGQQLPFQNNSFDGILCTEVIEHVVSPDRLLEEIFRIAKPDAQIAISLPNEHLINRVKGWISKLGLKRILFGGGYQVVERMDDEWHLHVFELKELVRKMSGRFKIRRITPIPFFFLPLRYVIACSPLKENA